ncbi:MAG TPA: hypothetical protein VFW64_12355 [Pseudonocardiaceae bacterium]|nr:hypothetical protein [Pseudonocardiaceae bacterium]
MEAIFAMVIIWMAFKTAMGGARDVTRDVYRRRADSWASRHPAVSPMPFAAKLGAGAATALTGGVHAGRGFAAGWRTGWAKGATRAQERRAARAGQSRSVPLLADQLTGPLPYVPAAESRPVVPVDRDWPGTGRAAGYDRDQFTDEEWVLLQAGRCTAVADFGPAFGSAARRMARFRHCGEPITENSRYGCCPRHEQEALEADLNPARALGETTPTITEGTAVTTIATNTGGEVHTMQQLIDELNQLAKQATAEQEDGEAAQKRTTEAVGWLDNLQASLEENDLDQQTLADVTNLADLFTQVQKLRTGMVAALDNIAAGAAAAATGVQARHGAMQEAIDATPHKAKDAFYDM